MLRGIRGATTATSNCKKDIIEASEELLSQMFVQNSVDSETVACIIFSSTADLDTAYPATAARNLGLLKVPLFGTQEANVRNGLSKCIRVLMLVNTERTQEEINHVYIGRACVLRQDLPQRSLEKGEGY
ncbi:MAG: chorismate mutase [Firmicutes bacterium]|jgi:monofunctional chorismate mutase|nr:chorismate mutase [Candidatus Fermentithermobacillaceae bacterium]